jgi:hypothetical protein
MQLQYVDPGTHLFRFMDHQTDHFWSAITDMLAQQELYLNSRTRFNDPYDSSPQIQDDLSPATIRAHAAEMFRNPWHRTRDPSLIPKLLSLKPQSRTRLNRLQISNIKTAMRNNTTKFLDECGLTSFSLTADNPLLWGHYAKGFTGVCVVFRRSTSMQSALCLCAKVLYVEKRPQLPTSLFYEMARAQRADNSADEFANKIFFLSFLHKAQQWQYEHEARICYPFYASKKVHFNRDEIIAIIIGPRSPSDLEERLRATASELAPAVQVHRASLSASGFEILLPQALIGVPAAA